MTETPIHNRWTDLFGQLVVLPPRPFGSLEDFHGTFSAAPGSIIKPGFLAAPSAVGFVDLITMLKICVVERPKSIFAGSLKKLKVVRKFFRLGPKTGFRDVWFAIIALANAASRRGAARAELLRRVLVASACFSPGRVPPQRRRTIVAKWLKAMVTLLRRLELKVTPARSQA